jgi:predicted HD superfamily hydrolase involved in NAD metabolism
MELTEATQAVKKQLRLPRFEHTLRVTETAEELAIRFDGSVEKVKLAAVLHDYAKERPIEELKQWVTKTDLPNDLLDYSSELLHGPVGSILVREELDIDDTEILHAIRFHTTGKAKMNKIEKIIFVADYIEPGRHFKGLDEVRKAAKQDLDYACWLVSRNTIQYLLTKEAKLYPDSIYAYNDLMENLNGVMMNEQ